MFLPALWFSPRSARGRRMLAFGTQAPQCNGRGSFDQGRLGIYGIAHAFVPAGTWFRRTAGLITSPTRSGGGGLLRPAKFGTVHPDPMHEDGQLAAELSGWRDQFLAGGE